MLSITIKTRLGLSLVILLLLVTIFGGYLLRVQERLSNSILKLETQSHTIQLLSNLQLAVQESLMPANDYIITANTRYIREYTDLDLKIAAMFEQIAQKGGLKEQELARITTARDLYGGVKRSALEIFSLPATDPGQPKRMESMDYEYGAPMIKEVAEVKAGLEYSFAYVRAESTKLRKESEQITMVALGTLVLLLLFVGLVQVRTISRSLDEIVQMLTKVAEGERDLTQRIVIRRGDEVGKMAELFNRFLGQVHGAIRDVVVVTGQLTSSARSVQSATHRLHASAADQLRVTAASTDALEGLSLAVTGIAGDAEELSALSTNAAAASHELSASFDEVVRLTEQLDYAADVTLSTVDTINDSSERVARNVADLLGRAHGVVDAVSQVHGMAGEIVVSAREQAQIASDVQDDATRLGLTAITNTTSRMEKLRETISDAAGVMESLGRISGEIGRIVNIIGEVTGKTNLLALNASIIAAQAGEFGKSFAVVAEEVKLLAQRTTSSTKEIELMVDQVREKTALAIRAVDESVLEAEAGVVQAREVAAIFTAILKQTAASQAGAELVAIKADRQSEGVVSAMGQIEEMRVMVGQISDAAEEQSRCAAAIVQATRDMRNYTREVRDNVGSQSDENMRITKISQDVFARVQLIAEVTLRQKDATITIADGQSKVLAAATENQVQSRLLDETVETLDQQAAVLEAKVGSFRI